MLFKRDLKGHYRDLYKGYRSTRVREGFSKRVLKGYRRDLKGIRVQGVGSWFQDSAFNEGRVAGFQGPRALQDPQRPQGRLLNPSSECRV